MQNQAQTSSYQPELIPRRGEWVAWGTTVLVGVGWLILRLMGSPVPRAVIFLGIVLLLAAASISLGNWMDRRTRLSLGPNGLTYENGLRRTHLAWSEIRQVQVFPSQWGDKVRVIGAQAACAFRTLGEVKVQGELKGRMGFQARSADFGAYLGRERFARSCTCRRSRSRRPLLCPRVAPHCGETPRALSAEGAFLLCARQRSD